jgi:hypothetical protein
LSFSIPSRIPNSTDRFKTAFTFFTLSFIHSALPPRALINVLICNVIHH